MPLVESFQEEAAIDRVCDVKEGYVFPAMALQRAFLFPLDSNGGLISTLGHVFENGLFQLTLS